MPPSSDADPDAPRQVVDLGSVHLKIEQPARPDGYRPISDPIWVWGSMVGFPGGGSYKLFGSAARRLDTGHQQIERVRAGLTEMPALGSIPARQRMHEIIGDAEMGVWAIDKAVAIALSLRKHFSIERPIPEFVLEKQPLVRRLRDHYSHIDERALGLVWRKPDATAEEAFEFGALIEERVFTDGRDSLDIDKETTELCIQTRDYLIGAWTDLTAR